MQDEPRADNRSEARETRRGWEEWNSRLEWLKWRTAMLEVIKVPRQKGMLICRSSLRYSGYLGFMTISVMETGTETEFWSIFCRKWAWRTLYGILVEPCETLYFWENILQMFELHLEFPESQWLDGWFIALITNGRNWDANNGNYGCLAVKKSDFSLQTSVNWRQCRLFSWILLHMILT